jgi:hypothetical protein
VSGRALWFSVPVHRRASLRRPPSTSTANEQNLNAGDRSEVRTTQTRCEWSDLGCEQRICVATNSNTIATDAFAVRKTQKWLPPTKNRPRAAKNRAGRCKTPDRGLYRSRCALIAVQNFTNGLQTHPSQFKTTQTDRKRTHRSSKRRKRTANALIAVQNNANGLQRH